ncbi:MAG: hypothetical protein AB7F35_00785 [Acetobacteraceae bacterium]
MATILQRAEMLIRAEQKAGSLPPRFDPQLTAVSQATEERLQRLEAMLREARTALNRQSPPDTRRGGSVLDGEG